MLFTRYSLTYSPDQFEIALSKKRDTIRAFPHGNSYCRNMSETLGNPVLERGRSRIRAFRPLLIWFCLSLVIVAWSAYDRMSAGTPIYFKVAMQGGGTGAPVVTLDGATFKSGQSASFGKRTLSVSAQGFEPFEKTLMVWFAKQNLGEIRLSKMKGTLVVAVEPRPRTVSVSGEGIHESSGNSTSTFGPVPIGSYRVVADFGLFKEERNVEVHRNETERLEIKPMVGTLDLASQPTNANYQLSGVSNRIHLEGVMPAHVEMLPAGEYRLRAWRGDYKQETRVDVVPGDTNSLQVKFAYAEVRFETTPAGAKVFGAGGELGETPLALREQQPGLHKFRIQKEGFMSLDLALDAMPSGVHSISTNLVNVRYGEAMQQAKRFAGSDYRAALSKLEEALQALPNDEEALELKAKLESTLKTQETQLADRKQAIELAAAGRQQEAQLRAAAQRQLAEQAARKLFPAETFRKASENEPDAELFDPQLWSVKSDAGKVADALRRMLQREEAGWKLANEIKVNDETFQFRCNGVSKLLSTSRRHIRVKTSKNCTYLLSLGQIY
ncbi:MAG TPA: PEGA domain-containing protein [Terriglobales bacterium]|jgi:hypothetical protein